MNAKSALYQAAENLRDAAEKWEDALNEVAEAIHGLTDDVDEDLLPTQLQNMIADVRRLDPDMAPPQDLTNLADDLMDATSE
ncbi:MAG: hypothetical protein GF334_10320 [Candidatus Altiarchaeales archaeon]|nr:hypothetical protein [Candidatus Altiarchaeales archaeon]